MIGPVHDEAGALGDRTEAADDQPVADERIVVEDAFVDETVGPRGRVVIGEIADLDIVRFDQRLQEADARMQWHRVFYRGVWSIHRSLLSDRSARDPPRDPVI